MTASFESLLRLGLKLGGSKAAAIAYASERSAAGPVPVKAAIARVFDLKIQMVILLPDGSSRHEQMMAPSVDEAVAACRAMLRDEMVSYLGISSQVVE